MEALPELQSQTTKALISIRETLARIKKLPPDYDFQLPTLISHADDYSDDLPRLRRYAGQVISARIMQFGYTALYKTYYFLDMFLRGYSDRNWPSSKHADWVRLSRRSKYAFVTAVNVSAGPTDKASGLIVRHVLDGHFPFAGDVYFPKEKQPKK
jgi:hypothetical protein